MLGEPVADLGLLIGGVVVHHQVQQLAGRIGAGDTAQESEESLVAVPGFAHSGDLAGSGF